MKRKNKMRNATAPIPESFKVSEARIQEIWEEKTKQFASFKDYFKKKMNDHSQKEDS